LPPGEKIIAQRAVVAVQRRVLPASKLSHCYRKASGAIKPRKDAAVKAFFKERQAQRKAERKTGSKKSRGSKGK
jgi:hypothetical protein